MATSKSKQVADRLPGLRFRLVEATRQSKATGIVTLRCEIYDLDLWERAKNHFDGYKIFTSPTEEIIGALGNELDDTAELLRQEQQATQLLRQELQEKDETIAKLQGVLARIGVNLGIT